MARSWLDYYKIITANAQANAALRANSPAAVQLPFSYLKNANFSTPGAKPGDKGFFPGGGLNPIENTVNVGKRLLDILGRGNYMSANTVRELQRESAAGGHYDPLKILSEAWQGLSGQDKTMYADVSAARGLSNEGPVAFARNFALDVFLDPTTYIGVGAVKHGVDVVKGIAGKSAAAAVKTPVERAVQQVVQNGAAEVATKNSDAILEHIAKNAPNPAEHAAVANIQNAMPKTVAPVPGQGPRLFVSGPEGVTSERFMLPGPPTPVLAARAEVANIEKAAKGVPQFKYGHSAYGISDIGPYKESIVPQLPPPVTEAGKVTETTLRKAVLDKGSEKVKINGKMMEMGKLRSTRQALLQAKATPSNVRYLKEIEDAINKHLQMVQNHAKAEIAKGNYADLKDYMSNFGYLPGPGLATKVDKPAEFKFDFEKGPTQEEVKIYQKMTPTEKMAFYQQYPFLDRQDLRYLAQASNQKSFQTRLTRVRQMPRNEPTKNIADLVEGLKSGRITDPTLLQNVMKLTRSSNIEELTKNLESAQGRLKAAEDQMFGTQINQAATAKVVPDTGVKELKASGEEFQPFGSLPNAVAAAKERIAREVKPAEQIIAEVKAGDKSALAREIPRLTVNQGEVLKTALQQAINREVVQPNSDLYKYLSKRGFKRTSPKINEGLGRNPGVWNKFSQYTVIKDVMANAPGLDAKIKEILKAKGAHATGPAARKARAEAFYDLFMPTFHSLDNILKSGGVFPVAGIEANSPVFSIADALEALGRDFAVKHFFTAGKGSQNIPPTMLMDALSALYSAFKRGDVLTETVGVHPAIQALLQHGLTRGGKTYTNYLASHINRLKGSPRFRAVEDLQNQIIDAIPDLAKRIEANTAERKLWHDNNVDKVKTAALDDLAKIVLDPEFGPGDIAGVAAHTDEVTVKVAQRLNAVDPNDIWMAKQEVRAEAPTLGLTPEAAANGAAADSMARASTPSAKLAVGTKIAQESEKQADEIAQGLPIDHTDLGQRFERNIVTRLFKGLAPHLGNSSIRPLFLNRNSFAQTYMRRYSAALNDISRKHTKESLIVAFNEIKQGTRSTVPEIAAAQDDLQQAINVLFSKDPKYNVYSRNNITAENINDHFAHYGIHEKFKFSNEIPMNETYKSWDTNDPLDLLSRIQAATIHAMSKRLLADDIAYHFGSRTPKEGYIKVSASRKTASELSKYLDFSLYYPREIAQQFHVLDSFMTTAVKATGHEDYRKVLNFYDNILHSYKAGLTIYRPGHHVRNMVGDVWLSWMAGVQDPRYYAKALKIMYRYRGRYNDFDALQAIMAREPVKGTARGIETGGTMATVRIKGKGKVQLNGDQVYRAMSDAGLLNDYRTLEDIQMGQESLFQSKFRPFGGKLQKAAATTSEARDHYVRVAQFLYELEKGSYRSIKEAADAAARNTRKWHPDGTDLTRFESAVMRRSFLFYSWIRKAIPLVAESAVMQPGKFMMYPKAMYDWAESQGIDLNSFQDPFPVDQVFPSWITDNVVGPFMRDEQGHYIGVNPGVPLQDVIHDFGGSQAGRSVLGSLSPVAKIPLETILKDKGAVAQDIRTGVPIYDLTDYIDRQLPGAGYAASITGLSPSSGFTQPKGGEPRPGQQAPGFNALALFNLITGASMQDWSKPNYIKQGNKERQTRLRQQSRDARGG
jgi:hypothetical protein